MFRKSMAEGHAGDNIGALVRGMKRDDVERGQVLAQPGSVSVHKAFEAQIYVLKEDEGGRHTPFLSNYRPQFFIRTADVTGTISLQKGTEMVMPGDNVSLDVELFSRVALHEGLRFAVREGGRTVAAGVVSKIVE